MLIFLKSALGLHKYAHFFPILLHFSDFQLHFSTTKWQSTLSSYLWSALAGWLPLLLDDNVGDAILDRVCTGCLEGNRWPIKPIPQASSGSFDWNEGKMRLWTT